MKNLQLRSFNASDCAFLMSHYNPNLTTDESKALIDEWNQKSYQGAYFEMFAIVHGTAPAGWISLYAHDEITISAGMEVIESARGKGLAAAALAQALNHAKMCGYTTATAQVRKNNAASLRLHEKCGFVITGECVTSQGNAAVWLRREL